jgi:hypothetical protein
MKISAYQIVEQEIYSEANQLAVYKDSYPLSVVEKEGRIFLTIASPIYEFSLRGKPKPEPMIDIEVSVLRNGMSFAVAGSRPSKFVGSVNVTKTEKKQLVHPSREQWVDVPTITTYHVFWHA